MRIFQKIKDLFAREEAPLPEENKPEHSAVLKSFDPLPDVQKPGYVSLTRYNPEWFTDAGGEWINPITKETERIRVTECATFTRTPQGPFRHVFKGNQVLEAFKNIYNDYAKGLLVMESNSDHPWGMYDSLSAGAMDLKNYPFQPGPNQIQMYTYDYWRMLSMAHEAANYNPLAKAGLHYKAEFAMGTGPKISCGEKIQNIQQAWDAYTNETGWVDRWRIRTRSLLKNGNLFLESMTDKNKKWKVRSLFPGKFYDMVTEPDDLDIIYGYVLMYQTKYQTFGQGAKGEQVNLTEFRFETIAPDNILHLKINVEEDEVWGRSDLLAAMDILQWFMAYLKTSTLRSWKQAQFAWDVTVENAQPEDIEDITKKLQQQPHVLMGNFVHGSSIKREPSESTSSSGNGKSDTFTELVTAFSTSICTAGEYMGLSQSGTRATSITATEPSMKIFIALRSIISTGIRWEFKEFCKQNGMKDVKDSDFEIMWPDLVPENAAEKIQNLLLGYMNGASTHRRFSDGWAREMEQRSYNYEQEQKDRAAEHVTMSGQQLGSSVSAMYQGRNAQPNPADQKGGQYKSGGIDNSVRNAVHDEGQA